ncbi:MAG: 3-dehydroquinate synthase [Dermatophilus congolensis]|nr:3-dehydroquinate synthase [Dermatophilus congolensis]
MTSANTRIHVGPPQGAGAYDVVIGSGDVVAAEIGALIGASDPTGSPERARVSSDPALSSVTRALIVHAAPVADLAAKLGEILTDAGVQVLAQALPDGEAAKTVEVAADLWARMGAAGFTRSDVVIAVGGGAVTDLGGFVAATWLRGVPVVNVPTTLLGMVDAAVGGKTGINTAEGKNLVGSFHPPAGVLVDLASLGTLPQADLAAGMAEVVKGGFIADTRILELVEADPAAALDPASPVLRELVERKIAVKADVVTRDLRESSLREILNYGHTFAHAIENLENYRWRHGDAVSVGMVFAAELAQRAGLLDAESVARHRTVLQSLGLPVSYRGDRFDEALEVMRRDKKTRAATLRFVALDAIGSPTRLVGPDEAMLRAAYEAVSD